ncbi:MAG: glyoxalase [Bradyrhizobium sp.]|nr:glyoxalase [Bradyrhizobium sp.]
MIDCEGRFAWYELLTTDLAAAKAFYRDVVGWEARDASTPQMAYSLLTSSDAPVAGLMELPEEGRRMGATPRWVGYVAVDDVDATADRLKRLGGTVFVPPTDSNIGRVSIVADAQTATLALVGGLKPERRPAELHEPGQVGWHELLAADGAKAFAFYSELFGWQKVLAETETVPMDSYQTFAAGDVKMGGMFTKLARVPVPFWLYYFNVADVGLSAARVRAGGGKVAQGPTELTDGNWIVRCVDPQGAMFALQGKSSHRSGEQPAVQVSWSAEWGGFASRGRVIAPSESSQKSNPKSNPKSKPGSKR